MTVIADTSVLIDYLRGHDDARKVLSQAREAATGLSASVLTKVEILAGVRSAERTRTRAVLDSIHWLDVDDDLAERAGALANQYLRSHRAIEAVDFVIAATVLREDASLLTTNVKHFPMLTGLRAPYEDGH